jgi:integrase/recombinase XerD
VTVGSGGRDDVLPTEAVAFLRHLRSERGLAPATVEAYRRDLRSYAGHLRDRGLAPAEVTPEDVEGFVVWLRQRRRPDGSRYAEGSHARTVVAVRGLHRFLRVEGGAATDPASGVALAVAV